MGVIGGPTAHEMTDPDGDGIYSVSISLANGTTGNYTFLNGNCPDWSCKENIAGCLVPTLEITTIGFCQTSTGM